MRFVFLGILLLSVTSGQVSPGLITFCLQFNDLNALVRDGKIEKPLAKTKIINCLKDIKKVAPKKMETEVWAFPVDGYNRYAIGGTNGNGYAPKGYKYLDGNMHGGHPAHDIFIKDKNQDCLDDKTGKKVRIKSVLKGIVIACEPDWEQASTLRGGKYVMIYHSENDLVSYYAHLDSTFVKVGQIVSNGEDLGFLGRSGLNAFKKRSPTHLHIMILKVDQNQVFISVDPFKNWLK